MTSYTDYGLLLSEVITLIDREDKAQRNKWGVQTHSMFEWLTYTTEELGELAQAISEFEYRNGSADDVIKEATQVATLCLKIATMIKKKGG